MKIIAVIILVLIAPFVRWLLKPENAKKKNKTTFVLFYIIGFVIGLIIMWLLSLLLKGVNL